MGEMRTRSLPTQALELCVTSYSNITTYLHHCFVYPEGQKTSSGEGLCRLWSWSQLHMPSSTFLWLKSAATSSGIPLPEWGIKLCYNLVSEDGHGCTQSLSSRTRTCIFCSRWERQVFFSLRPTNLTNWKHWHSTTPVRRILPSDSRALREPGTGFEMLLCAGGHSCCFLWAAFKPASLCSDLSCFLDNWSQCLLQMRATCITSILSLFVPAAFHSVLWMFNDDMQQMWTLLELLNLVAQFGLTPLP